MSENPEPIKIMEYLLESRISIDHIQNVYDPAAATLSTGTALHQALERKDVERVQFLLQSGANRNIKGSRGLTALEGAEADEVERDGRHSPKGIIERIL
jgi:ankyrin repeat protein